MLVQSPTVEPFQNSKFTWLKNRIIFLAENGVFTSCTDDDYDAKWINKTLERRFDAGANYYKRADACATISLSLSHTHTHSLTFSLSLTHTHTHTLSHCISTTLFSLFVFIYLFLSHLVLLTHTFSLSPLKPSPSMLISSSTFLTSLSFHCIFVFFYYKLSTVAISTSEN